MNFIGLDLIGVIHTRQLLEEAEARNRLRQARFSARGQQPPVERPRRPVKVLLPATTAPCPTC